MAAEEREIGHLDYRNYINKITETKMMTTQVEAKLVQSCQVHSSCTKSEQSSYKVVE